ncbi:hypothetical protein SLEP1_g33832 [Rubroshorea leprosula]|uniref:Secreted protein n=1 Tax=Rubroshorea leprosula TaxID=152421 RepID=A0AAV5KI03_9ROSI|nr:hypothetical protein SLEP1_g33832 [Rubroshorea leprosula]
MTCVVVLFATTEFKIILASTVGPLPFLIQAQVSVHCLHHFRRKWSMFTPPFSSDPSSVPWCIFVTKHHISNYIVIAFQAHKTYGSNIAGWA